MYTIPSDPLHFLTLIRIQLFTRTPILFVKIIIVSILAVAMIGLMAPSAFAELTITDDATGGDCSTVGTWDAGTRTCTFTSDVSEQVTVGANFITLDGNGHTIDSGTTYDNTNTSWLGVCDSDGLHGIYLDAKTNIVIKNFIIKNFCNGINFSNSINNSILSNTIIDSYADGITISTSSNDIISNNVLTNNGKWLSGGPNVYHAILLSGSSQFSIIGNTISAPDSDSSERKGIEARLNSFTSSSIIENNSISDMYRAIYAVGYDNNAIVPVKNNIIDSNQYGIHCTRCDIVDNTITNNSAQGIYLTYNNEVRNNIISNNDIGIYVTNGPNNVYRNTISNNDQGVDAGIYHGSVVYVSENNFLNNAVQALGNSYSDFDQLLPYTAHQDWIRTTGQVGYYDSGNYWNDYSHLCPDTNVDNICDDPYPFSGGTINIDDDYVWIVQDGWLTQITTPGNITLEAPDNSGVVGTYSAVSATHDGSAMSVTCDTSSGDTFPIGTTTVLCTAQNGIKSTFDVTVNLETTPPVISVPADITINLAQGETESAATFSVTATDNFAVTVGPTCSAESGAIFQIGNSTITCTTADAAGNVGTGSFTVQVIEYDSTPPVVTVPSNISLNEVASNVGAVGTFSVSANDNVDSTVTTTCDTASGATFPVGTTTITCTAQDANGNSGTASFTVTVVEYVPPYLVASNARFIDSLGNTISEAVLGQQVQIVVDVTNEQAFDQAFAYLIYEQTGDLVWITGQLYGGQLFSPALTWTPQSPGDHTFTVRFIEAIHGCIIDQYYSGNATVDDLDLSAQSCTTLTDPITLQMNIPLPPESTTIQNAQGSSSPGCEPNCFIPSHASVSAGSQITFVNNDNAAHTSTSGTATNGADGTWDSSLIMPGSNFSVILNNPGTYPYFCMVHPWMQGTIYVDTSIPDAPQPDAELSLSLNKNEFDLDELITVGASISEISGTADVTIDVTDPNGNPVITRMLDVGNSTEQLDFRISDRFVVGYYKISASSNIGGNVITDHIFFNIKSQYDQFQIESVQVTDQQGNASTLERGEMAHIKVTLTSNINIEPLVTVNLFDSSLTTLGVGSIRAPINEGESEIILSFLIPEDAALGNGTIYVNAFTDWVSNGGVSLTGEVSKSENISS